MPDDHSNEHVPYGRSAFVSEAELEAAGLFTYSEDAIYAGKAFGRKLWIRSPGGALLCAGARSGKLTDIIAQIVSSGVLPKSSMLILDPRGEIACVTLNQVADKKHVIHFNPHGLHSAFGIQQQRLNPFSLLKWSSKTLFSDVKQSMRGLLMLSGAPQAQYFELNARRIAEAISLTLIKKHGVLTFPDLYDAIMRLNEGSERWIDFAYDMYRSGIAECKSVEAEIYAAKNDTSGGWKGILGELRKSVSALSDKSLLDALSPPYDFEMEDLGREDQTYHLHLITPALQIEDWAPVIKTIFTSARILKERSPSAPRQTWLLDEAGRLQGFAEVVQLFTDGAGIGIRPIVVLQHLAQARAFCAHGDQLIASSAATQIFFGTRDQHTANLVSDMIGPETLEYRDPMLKSSGKRDLVTALKNVFGGADPFEMACTIAHAKYQSSVYKRLHRMLRTPSEIRNLPRHEMMVFTDGLSGPIAANREPYWEQRWMAGKYLPNPFHKPHDKVKVMTRWGPRWRKVITEPVPEEFEHLPQYRGGTWSYVARR